MASRIPSSLTFPSVPRQDYHDGCRLTSTSAPPPVPVKSSLRETAKSHRRLTPIVPMASVVPLFKATGGIPKNEIAVQDIRSLQQDITPLREKLLCAIEEVRFLAEKLAESERRAKAIEKECIQTRDQLGIFVVENEVLRRDLERIKLALHESESLRHQRKERFLFPFPNGSWDSDICRKTDTFSESTTTYYRTVPTSTKQLFKLRDPVYRNL